MISIVVTSADFCLDAPDETTKAQRTLRDDPGEDLQRHVISFKSTPLFSERISVKLPT